jgi:hypothetical protein
MRSEVEEREAMRRWVQNWKELRPELDVIRALPPRESSGLVGMQDLFAKLRSAVSCC